MCPQFNLLRFHYTTDTSTDLLGKIRFKYCTINSNLKKKINFKQVFHPNTGTTDNSILSKIMHSTGNVAKK